MRIFVVSFSFAVLVACSGNGPGAAPPPPYVAPTIAPGAIALYPASLSFTQVPASAPVTISETGYGGSFNATLACGAATVSPKSATPSTPGGAVAFTVTAGLVSGSCTLSISDTAGHTQTLPVTVTIGTIGKVVVSPATLTMTTVAPATFVASETNYGATLAQFFSATATCTPADTLASLTTSAFPTGPGGPATFTAYARTAGTCSVNVVDGFGQSATLALSASRLVAAVPAALVFVDATPQTIVASEGSQTAFAIDPGSCGALVAVAPLANATASFRITPTSGGLAQGADCSVSLSDGLGGVGTVHVFINQLTIGIK